MGEYRLLEKIRALEKQPQKRLREDPKRIIDSVLAHLQRILNTRQDSVPISDEYGLPDLTDLAHQYPDSLRWFQKEIRKTIGKYEPRLKAVRVRFIPDEEDPLTLRFQISGRLATRDRKDPIRFESVVGSDGKISLKR